MAYATLDEFKSRYGDVASDGVINLALTEQGERIDYYTLDRITNLENGFIDLSPFRQARIKTANIKGAYHQIVAEGLANNTDDTNGNGITSFKLGDLNISKVVIDRVTLDVKSNNKIISEMGSGAFEELSRSGLLYKGILEQGKVDLAYRVDESV